MRILYFTQIDPPAESIRLQLAQKGWEGRHLVFRQVVFQKIGMDPSSYDALLLSSKQAVRWLLAQDFQQLPPLAVVGAASSALLPSRQLLFPQKPPANAAELAERLGHAFPQPSRFLFLRGRIARDTLANVLTDHHLEQRIVYSTEKLSKKFHPLVQGSMVYFQAPSTVADYFEHFCARPGCIGVIGPSTAQAVESLGWSIDFQPSRPENRHFAEELPAATRFFKEE